MVYEEIIPYLNQIVKVNLVNKKRKLGWLIIDNYHEVSEEPLKEVHCVNVRFGKKHFHSGRRINMDALKGQAEIFQIKDILNIRSCL